LEEERITYSLSKAAEFKTRSNSASPNVISAQRSTPSEKSNEAAMRIKRSID